MQEKPRKERSQRVNSHLTIEILDSIYEGVAVVDRGWTIIYVNQQAATNAGFKSEELIGQNLWKMFPQILGTAIEAYYRKEMTERKVQHFEISGVVNNLQHGITVYPLSEGIALCWHDITERRKSEEENKKLVEELTIRQAKLEAQSEELRQTRQEAQESRDKYLDLFDFSPVGYLTIDKDGNILEANLTAAWLLGMERNKLIHSRFTKFIAPDFQDTFYSHLNHTIETDVRRKDEILIRRADSSTFYAQLDSIAVHTLASTEHIRTTFSNITERKKAEDDLRKSEEKFRQLNYSMNEGAASHEVIYDDFGKAIDYVISDVNPAYESITGLKKETVLGRKASEVYSVNEPPYLDIYARVASLGEPTSFETYFPPMGKHFSISVYSLGKGKFATIFSDITERKKTEEAFKESEEKFFKAFHLSPVAQIMTSLIDGRCIDANISFLSLTGYTREEVIGHSTKELNKIASTNQPAKTVETFLETGSISNHELTALTKTGKRITVLSSASRIILNGQEHALSTIIDITERKKAEETLHQSQTLLQAVWDGSPDPVYVKDKKSRILMANPALEKVVGKPAAEIIGKTDSEYYDDEAAGQDLRKHDLQVMKSGSAFTVEETVPTPDGPHTFLSSKAPYRDASGDIIGIIGISHDITLRKRAEESRDRYARELESANKELETFSYSVSHDLRAPLRTLDGFSEALLSDCGDKLDETGKGYLNRVRKASQTMSQLIDGMLKLSRISRADMHENKVNLSEIAQSIAEELKADQPDRQTEVVIAPGIWVKGDKQLLQIFLNNLLQNAWKFTEKCPVARIELGVIEKNGEKVYFIKDNGAGFNMKYSDKLFQPFQRLHSKEEFPGMGIGLATVQRVIHRHGGRIWAESEIGKGATFYFELN